MAKREELCSGAKKKGNAGQGGGKEWYGKGMSALVYFFIFIYFNILGTFMASFSITVVT